MASKVLLMKQQRAVPVCLAVSTRLSMSKWERSVGPKWLVPTVICTGRRVALHQCLHDGRANQLLLDLSACCTCSSLCTAAVCRRLLSRAGAGPKIRVPVAASMMVISSHCSKGAHETSIEVA